MLLEVPIPQSLERDNMKFTILLPTRNRLDLLKYAVESIRMQNYRNWEIVISDNASEEDIKGYITSLADQRIRYFRTASFVPVTDNWNNALHHASGDYIIMLGDDDALMPEYLNTLSNYIDIYAPEVIYTDAYQFAYPNVMPGHASGFIQQGYTEFLNEHENDSPYWLDKVQALNLVRKSMSFRISFGFNMQHYLVSRKIINDLSCSGEFYQSPYPDYYASNILLFKADKVLIVPFPLVVIGISPKSFGYYYFNEKESVGDAFLLNSTSSDLYPSLESVILPGSSLYTSWLYAMQTVKDNFDQDNSLNIDYSRYRFFQILTIFRRAGLPGLWRIMPRINAAEITKFLVLSLLYYLLISLGLNRFNFSLINWLRDFFSIAPKFDLKMRAVSYKNILEMVLHE